MSAVYSCCQRPKKYGWNNHADWCWRARREAMDAHPAGTALADECPAHEGEDRILCRPCESLAEERRERTRADF